MKKNMEWVIQSLNSERIQIRIDARSYNILQKAASLEYESLSDFIKTASLAKAKKSIELHEKFILSEVDWENFLDNLANPPPLNKNLRKAFKKYLDATSNA